LADPDVLVVGGGPAGSAAAAACAAAGLRVIVAERERFPRSAPGETLHPGIEPLLDRLGAGDAVRAAGFLRHPGNWVAWGGPPRFDAFGADAAGPWLGFQAVRAEFDAILLAHAAAAGAEVRQPCRVGPPVVRDGRVVGAKTDRETVRARFTVDATGRRGWLAGHLGLPVERVGPRRVAWYGYTVGSCPARDEAPALVADRAGWTWTARVREGLYHWTHLPVDPVHPPRGWLPDEFRGLAPSGPTRGADVTWRSTHAAGPGYFLVGDAAAVLDPAASHGVLKALMTGMMAAHLIRGVTDGRLAEDEAAAGYAAWVADGFRHDAAALCDLYARLPWHGAGSRPAQRGLPAERGDAWT
jgi:flavin-dependent dehydrogenase